MTGRDEMHWAENGGIDVSQHAEFDFEGIFTGGGRDMGHPDFHPSSERDRTVTLLCHVMLQVWFLWLSKETGTVIIIMGKFRRCQFCIVNPGSLISDCS